MELIPGVYKFRIQGTQPVYDRVASHQDTIRIVLPDGSWFEVSYDDDSGMLMVRAMDVLAIRPDMANKIGLCVDRPRFTRYREGSRGNVGQDTCTEQDRKDA